MQLSSYMTNIVSEVKFLGRAYVDSLMAPEDDHHDGENCEKTADGSNGSVTPAATVVGALGTSLANLIPGASSFIPSSRGAGASDTNLNDECSSVNPEAVNFREVGGGCSAAVVGPAHSSCTRYAKALGGGITTPSAPAPVEEPRVTPASTTIAQKMSTRKSASTRSKFGAVKMVMDPAEVQCLERLAVPSGLAATSPALGHPCGFKGDVVEPVPELVSEAQNWNCIRDEVVQLLKSYVERQVARSAWASGVLRRFADNAIQCLPRGANHDSLSNESTKKTVPLNTSLSGGVWWGTESSLRTCLRNALPAEVWRLDLMDAAPNPSAGVGSPLSRREDASLPETFQTSLKSFQHWCQGRQLYTLLVSEDRTHHHSPPMLPLLAPAMEQCMMDMFISCLSPLIRGVAKSTRESLQSRCVQQKQPHRSGDLPDINSLCEWGKQLMDLFCAPLNEAEKVWKRRVQGTSGDNAEHAHTVHAMVTAVQTGTAALWLMREAAIMTLLLVWSLLNEVA